MCTTTSCISWQKLPKKTYIKNVVASFFLLFGVVSLSSCSKDCVKSTGDVITQERFIGDFSQVKIYDGIDVVFRQDVPGKIFVEAGENLMPKIKTYLSDDGVLVIENKNKCDWVRSYKKPLKVYIGANQVKLLTLIGFGKVTSEGTITTDTLRINSESYAEIDLQINAGYLGFMADKNSTFMFSGNAEKVAGRCYVNSKVDLSRLNSKYVYMINYSPIASVVQADSVMHAEIGGNGDIECYGSPPIVYIDYKSGSGRLILK